MKALVLAILFLSSGAALANNPYGLYEMEPVPHGTFDNVKEIEVVQNNPPVPQDKLIIENHQEEDFIGWCFTMVEIAIEAGAKDVTCTIPQGFITFNRSK